MKTAVRKILAVALTFMMVLSTFAPVMSFAAQSGDSSVTVYLTVSKNGWFFTADDAENTTLARVPIEVDYFPLSDYGLEMYNRYEANSYENGGQYIGTKVIEKPTLLHLIIKATEQYMLGGEKYDPEVHSDILRTSGGACSIFFENFWGMGYNLNYYVDHMYPLMAEGWGATADYILLEDNMEIDLAVFENYYFYSDENSGFAYFKPSQSNVYVGDTVEFETWKTAQDWCSFGNTVQNPCDFLTTLVLDETFTVVERITAGAENGGVFSYTFNNPGTYYVVALDENLNASNPSLGSTDSRIAPGVSKITVAEKPVVEETRKAFCLVAEDDEKLIIEPEWVYYEDGQTIKDALDTTVHTFDGIDQGFIYSINGVIYSPYRTSDNGVYEFDKEASEIANVFRFSMSDRLPGNQLVALLKAMADYNGNQEYKDSDEVTAVYNEAKAAYIGIDSETAEIHEQNLRNAMAKVDNAEKYSVAFDVTQGGVTAKGYDTFIYNDKGTKIDAQADGTYMLRSGTYVVEISKEYNAAYGKVTVTDANQIIAVKLPSGHHFENNIFLTRMYATDTEFESLTANGLLSKDFSSDVHEYTVLFPDNDSISPYVHSTNEDAWKSVNAGEYFIYHQVRYGNYENGTAGYFGNGKELTMGSTVLGLLEDFDIDVQVRLTHEVADDNGFVQIQSYYINVQRTRTISSLEVHNADGALALTQNSKTGIYSATVTNDTQSVKVYPKASGTYSGGYRVTVNGTPCDENGFVEVALGEGSTTVEIAVSYLDKSSNKYTLNINKDAPYQSVITVETEGATLELKNAAGTLITPEMVEDNVYTYQLPTEATYTVVASKGANRASRSFPAKNVEGNPQFEVGKAITLAVREENDWLSELAFGTATGSAKKGTLELSPAFDSTVHNYNLILPEDTANPAAWATVNENSSFPATSKTIKAVYTKLPTTSVNIGTEASASVTVKNANKSGASLTALNGKFGTAEPFEIQVTSNANGIAYTQVYTITPVVNPLIRELAIEADGATLALDPAFDEETLSYTVSASELTKNFTVTAELNREINSLRINGKSALSEETVTVSAEEIVNNTISVTAVNKAGVENTYSILINSLPALDVRMNVQPAESIVYITDDTGMRVNAQTDGTYKMLAGATYNYTVTCSGYVAQSGTYTVPETGEGFTVSLEEAPVNEKINKDLDAEWPMFRGDNTNNSVVSHPAPKTADEAVLYWATQDGEGFDSNAIGCPIIVNDYLVYCTGNKLHRMNRYTGEVDELKGQMVAKSSFNIIPPTYADGMIFVALSNGTIQAFNAETFESLWVYKDALGGQPNSPIVYQDGYIYTGFWTGETKKANFVCVSATDENPNETNEEKAASWTYTQLGGFYWAGAYACEDFILVGTDDGDSGYTVDTSNLLSFDAKTGELIGKISNLNADIRSSVSYDEVTDRYYFTTKGGSFYSVAVNDDGTFKTDENGIQGYDLKEIALYNHSNDSRNPAMSTCTPVIHNGRAYIGVSGVAQFGAYSGHNITVIDLASWSIAYSVRTKGYPQTSGLLTTAYESEDGYAYVYFIDNYTPGQVRVIKDKPGVTEVIGAVTESYMDKGELITVTCAPVLFTPSGAHAQYAICSPVSDGNGILYFKNDSAYMMAVGSKPVSIEIANQPAKTLYVEGEAFDTTDLKVVAKLANGCEIDVTEFVTFNKSSVSLTVDDTDVTAYYSALYGDEFNAEDGNITNVVMLPCEAYIPVTVITAEQKAALDSVVAKIDAIGEVTLESGDAINTAKAEFDALPLDIQDLVSNQQILADAEKEYDTIKNVYGKIDAIGEVTYSKSDAIAEADEAYKALTNEQKAKITNAETLENAKSALNLILAEIDGVVDKIDAIGTVTASKEQIIADARTAYDSLADDSKVGVSNVDKLLAAEAELAGLNGNIAKIEELINALGDVTYSKKAEIEAARAGFDALPEESQAKVSNADVLTAAENKLAELEEAIDSAEAKIDAIGEVTLEKENLISQAREVFDSLADDSKTAVENADKLTEAENALAELKAKVKNVEEAISSIGEVSVDKADEIENARTAYDALSDDLKAAVSNADVLTAAEAELESLLADVKTVEEKIAALDNITVAKKDEIKAVREAYDALPAESKAVVKNLERLENAESVLATLKAEIKAVEEKISAIGEITSDKKDAIEAARAAYDALGTDSKVLVSNYNVLVAAETKFDEFFASVADVEAKINAIGTVLLSKEDEIKAAREAYDELTDDAKELVSNYETLEKAEKIFNILDMLFGWIVKIFDFLASIFKSTQFMF